MYSLHAQTHVEKSLEHFVFKDFNRFPSVSLYAFRLNLNRPHSPVLMDHEEGGVTNDGKVDDSLASPSARKKNFQPNEIGNDSNLHHEIMTSPDREIHNEKSKKTPQKTIETQAGVDTSNAATGNCRMLKDIDHTIATSQSKFLPTEIGKLWKAINA